MIFKIEAGRAVLAAAIVTSAMPTLAQSAAAADPATAPVAPTPDNGLQEIVVTAQRRTENAQKTSLALDVVSSRELSNAGVVTTATLNAAVPSLYVSKGGGVTTSYFIRGVGNFTQNGYSDPAVAFNVDGIYYGRPGSTVGTFYDLERIEVLKGPQGTLYGRNATGGAINVITARPILGLTSARGTFSFGNYNAINVDAFVNLPLGDKAAFRLSGTVVDRNGFNSDGTADEVGQAIRGQLLFKPTPALSIRLSADYAHGGGKGIEGSYTGRIATSPGSAATATSPANYTVVPSGLEPRSGIESPADRTYYAGIFLGGPRINPAPLPPSYQKTKFYGGSAEVTLDTGAGVLTFLPAYRESKINTLSHGPSFYGSLIHEKDTQFSTELRFAGKRIGPVDWLLGGYYFDEKIAGQYNFSQYTVNSFQIFTNTTKSYAAFGRLTFNLTDQLRLVGAARYTKDKKSFNGDGRNLIQICAAPTCIGGPSVPLAQTYAQLATMITLPTLPGPANSVAFGTRGNRLFYAPVPIVGKLDRSKPTYRGAIEFDIAPRSLLYASYETGYRSGGFNFSLGHETYEPEFIKAATLGIKNRFLDNKLQLNVEAFYWKYRNQQVSHFGLDATGGNSFFTENIGRSRIKGIDVDLQYRATPTTLLRGSIQLLDNKLSSFVYNTQRNTTNNALPPIVGCPATAGTAQIPGSTTGATAPVWVVNCSGRRGFNSPKLSINGGLEQTFHAGTLDVVATVDGRYRSNRSTSFEFLPFQESGSDVTADASLRIGRPDGSWSVTGYVQNLTNERVQTVSLFAETTGNVIVTNYAPPRTFGMRLSAGF